MFEQSLVPCVCVSERNLLADTAKIVERHKIHKRKDRFCRKIVADGLIALGYNASICKSKWEKSPSFLAGILPFSICKIGLFLLIARTICCRNAFSLVYIVNKSCEFKRILFTGEYEYVDVIIEGERLIIDIDFRSEFDIARPTKAYKLVLQKLPNIFIGKADRLEKIIGIVSEAARQSLKKKGMPFPPWRKADYVKSKWLSPFTRIVPSAISLSSACNDCRETKLRGEKEEALIAKRSSSDDELELILGEKLSPVEKIEHGEFVFVFSNSSSPYEDGGVEGVTPPPLKKWEPPEIRPMSINKGVKIVTGLASVIDNKP